ncbi:MAG TPA: phosphotransferase [Streptosporangiaceae bacterium]
MTPSRLCGPGRAGTRCSRCPRYAPGPACRFRSTLRCWAEARLLRDERRRVPHRRWRHPGDRADRGHGATATAAVPYAVWGGAPATMGRPVTGPAELVSHRDYYPGNVVFRAGLPAALIDFDLAKPTTRLYDIANALWYWAPLRDPRDRAPAFADADIPPRVAVFADAYGMTARQRAELAPLAVDMARRYHEDSRASAELDPVFRKLWEDGAKDELPRAEAWLREAAPAITARLGQPG